MRLNASSCGECAHANYAHLHTQLRTHLNEQNHLREVS